MGYEVHNIYIMTTRKLLCRNAKQYLPGLPSEEDAGGVGLSGCGLGAVDSPISLHRLLTSVM